MSIGVVLVLGLLLGASALLVVAEARGSAGRLGRERCLPSWRLFASAGVPYLKDVAALSASDVWAVGETGPPDARPKIVHWDGRRLHVSPAVGWLVGIAAVSADDVWAVGSNRPTHGILGPLGLARNSRPVVEHWDGSAWRLIPTPPLPASGSLTDVAALSHTDVWAVGHVGTRPLYEHWDGSRWQAIVASRSGALSAVDGSSGRNVWAVGAQGLTSYTIHDWRGLAMRWNGTRWREVGAAQESGDEGGTIFYGIDVLSSTEVWGMRSDNPALWDGRRWRDFAVAGEAARAFYTDIAAAGSSDVWGVGGYGGPHPVIVHWDGHGWRVRHTPFERRRGSLNSLSVVSPTEIWAVGDHLIARYSCS